MEVTSCVFLSTIRIPTSISNRLSRDRTPLSIRNCRPHCATIILTTKRRMSRCSILTLVLEMRMSNNIREVIGGVFSSAIAVPASVSVGFSRDVAPLGVGDGYVDVACAIVLVSTRHAPEALGRDAISDVGERLDDPGEVLGGVFFASVRVPASVSFCLSRDVAVLGVS